MYSWKTLKVDTCSKWGTSSQVIYFGEQERSLSTPCYIVFPASGYIKFNFRKINIKCM